MSLQVMDPPSKEVMKKVRGEFGLNEQRVRDAVEHLKDWIQLQPHLPKEIGTFLLKHCEEHDKDFISRQDETITLIGYYAAYVACCLSTFRSSPQITQNMVLKIRQ